MVGELMMQRDLLNAIERLLRPVKVRLANAIARGVVQAVSDDVRLQLLQLGVLAGEDVDDCERFQEYGFNSVPLTGAEAVVLFPFGDRSHPLVVAVDDRRYRPTMWEPGEAGVYNFQGAWVRVTKDGDIEVRPAAGRKVLVHDGSGGYEPLITKSQFDAHKHPTSAGISGVPDNAATSGTTVLEAK